MKAITLTQPWATLVAIGAKKIETRSWATSYRGPLAIHAAAGLGPVDGRRGLHDLCGSHPFCDVLLPAGYNAMRMPAWGLPRGAIVAVADLRGVIPVTGIRQHTLIDWPLTDQERAFGDYSPGRYAWLLADVRPLRAPIPAKGALGLWEWESPEGVAL